jgi:hypothetical protein
VRFLLPPCRFGEATLRAPLAWRTTGEWAPHIGMTGIITPQRCAGSCLLASSCGSSTPRSHASHRSSSAPSESTLSSSRSRELVAGAPASGSCTTVRPLGRSRRIGAVCGVVGVGLGCGRLHQLTESGVLLSESRTHVHVRDQRGGVELVEVLKLKLSTIHRPPGRWHQQDLLELAEALGGELAVERGLVVCVHEDVVPIVAQLTEEAGLQEENVVIGVAITTAWLFLRPPPRALAQRSSGTRLRVDAGGRRVRAADPGRSKLATRGSYRCCRAPGR